MTSEMPDAGWILGNVKDTASQIQGAIRGQHEQDSGHYRTENEMQVTVDRIVREAVRAKEKEDKESIREEHTLGRVGNQFTPADLLSRPNARSSDVGRNNVDEYVRIHRAAAGDLETIIDIIRQENLEDRLAYFVKLTESQINRRLRIQSRRGEDMDESDKITNPGSDKSSMGSQETEWAWANIDRETQEQVLDSTFNNSKKPIAPHVPPTGQGDAMLYTPNSLVDVDESFDDRPVDMKGEENFVQSPDVHSGHRSTYHTVIGDSSCPSQLPVPNPAGLEQAPANPSRIERPQSLKREQPPKPPATLEHEIETGSGAKVVSMSEVDDKSSIQSYNDSTFDDLESVLSSVSSLGDNAQALFVGAFVDLLIRDPSVDSMISRATSDAGIGVERFRRSFSRILKVYSRDLRNTKIKQGEKEHDHHRVAAFISRKTKQASSLVATRYKERAPKPDNSALERVTQYLDGLESEHSESSDEEEAGTVPTITGLETFLLQGKPFQALKWHLRSLVISNHRVEQVKVSAEYFLNFMFYDLGLEETYARAHERVPDFSTWLCSEIDVLATSMETELKAKSPATEYLSIYSDYLAAHVVQRLSQKTNTSDSQHSESSSPRQDKGKMHSTEIRPPEEILEDIMVARLPKVFGGEFSEPNAWAQLCSTKSFRDFASELSDAAYPTFFSEGRKALKAEIDSKVRVLSDQSEERYLLSILKELQCSTRHGRKISLSIESNCGALWLERLKLFIERSSGSEWSWWPLSPPPRAESPAHVKLEPLHIGQHVLSDVTMFLSAGVILAFLIQPTIFGDSLSQGGIRISIKGSLRQEILVPPYAVVICLWPIILIVLVYMPSYAVDFTRQYILPEGCLASTRNHKENGDCAKVISWLCTCGSTRRELVSSKYATLFRQLAGKYPMAPYDNSPVQSNGLGVPRTPSPSASGGSSASADTQSVDSSYSPGGVSSRGSVSISPSSTGSTAITMDIDRLTFVHLLVRKGDRYVISPMKVTHGDARGFFQDLIARYQCQRGFFRQFLSIFVYSHCDFVKVKRHRAYRVSPIPEFSFPEPGRDIEYHEYTYNPQPMIQVPITKHMFNDFFYSCYNSHNMKHSLFHKFLSSCDVIETLPQDLLESMPKRDREVMVGARFGKVEHLWGIVAREQRSVFRVVMYMLLSLVPTIWFMFMWMFSWGHEGDLQNATVPVTISLTTLSMVWIVVYSGGESGNE